MSSHQSMMRWVFKSNKANKNDKMKMGNLDKVLSKRILFILRKLLMKVLPIQALMTSRLRL